MESKEILPCPFCGAQLELSEALSNRRAQCFCHPVDEENPCYLASAAVWRYDDDTRNDGLRKWNGRAALSRPAEEEPVAWMCSGKGDGWEEFEKITRDPALAAQRIASPKWQVTSLYASPPAPQAETAMTTGFNADDVMQAEESGWQNGITACIDIAADYSLDAPPDSGYVQACNDLIEAFEKRRTASPTSEAGR